MIGGGKEEADGEKPISMDSATAAAAAAGNSLLMAVSHSKHGLIIMVKETGGQ